MDASRLVESDAHIWRNDINRGSSSMGLPGLNGFVGEFTILLGAWDAGQTGNALGSYWFAGLSALGVILAAVYMLFMFQKLFLGPVDKEDNRNLKDIGWREILTLAPILVFIFWIGIYPKPFFDLVAPSVDQLVTVLQSAALALH
jgi:NADH-quinone oxidoreductase subunit M